MPPGLARWRRHRSTGVGDPRLLQRLVEDLLCRFEKQRGVQSGHAVRGRWHVPGTNDAQRGSAHLRLSDGLTQGPSAHRGPVYTNDDLLHVLASGHVATNNTSISQRIRTSHSVSSEPSRWRCKPRTDSAVAPEGPRCINDEPATRLWPGRVVGSSRCRRSPWPGAARGGGTHTRWHSGGRGGRP